MRNFFERTLKSWVIVPVLFFISSANLSAEPEYPKVLAVSGEAEILKPPDPWRTLEAPALLKKGFKIRTGDKSSVEITWDAGLENVARLGENAHLDMLSWDGKRFFLLQGTLMILREESGSTGRLKTGFPLKIFTDDTLVEIGEGGCSVEVFQKDTEVKVFGEKADIFFLKGHRVNSEGKAVTEGFKFFSGKMDPRVSSRFQRMSYGDYADWQAWVRKSYERKDDLASDAFREGTIL